MTNENKVKFKRALSKVVTDVSEGISGELETGKALRFSLKIAGSENEVLMLIDSAKEPHLGKFNLLIGVVQPGNSKLNLVHGVVGQTKQQLSVFFAGDNIVSLLSDKLIAASDMLK